MYLNDDNTDTNIDDEFDDGSFLSIAISTIKKYKLIFLGAIVLEIIILIIIYFGSNKAINYLVLSGDETVTIYKGTSYVETGYEAFNSKNENLNNKVKVDTNLNTNKIGEYEILYSLDNLVKVRLINVVEKPDDYTYIELKTVNDQVDVNLKVGEQYNEPGYKVYSVGKNLTESVRVIGSVDSSKKGEYPLIYTVVDSNNVTVSVIRTVTVR